MLSFAILFIGFLQKLFIILQKYFFGGIKSNFFGKVFEDVSNGNAFW
jgi:N-acetylneuraminic acid mutarotase